MSATSEAKRAFDAFFSSMSDEEWEDVSVADAFYAAFEAGRKHSRALRRRIRLARKALGPSNAPPSWAATLDRVVAAINLLDLRCKPLKGRR